MKWYRRDWRSKASVIVMWVLLGGLTLLSVWVLLYLSDTVGINT